MKYHYLTRANYNAEIVPSVEGQRLVIVDGLEDDEPVLVLRARDPFAIAAGNIYRMITEGVFDQDKADDLERVMDRMIAWRQGHRSLLKDPD